MKIILAQFNHSGGEYLYRLANALAQTHEVLVLATERARDDTDLLATGDPDFRITFLEGTASQTDLIKKTLELSTFTDIRRIVRSFDPDVIHVVNEFFWTGILMPLLREYPFFVTVHEPSFRERHANRGVQTVYYRLRFPLNKAIRKRADGIFVHGPSTRDSLADHVPSERIWTIPHGQYTSFVNHSSDVPEETAVLFFGLIRDDKGLEYLLQSESKIIEAIKDVKFIIAGGGDIGPYKNGISNPDRFEIYNQYLDEAEAAKLFERAAVVVCPYTDATQSGVIASTYPFSKPVVSTTVGNIPVQVDHGRTGYLVPPADPDALARRVIELLSNTDRRHRMGAAARKKATTDFSWERVASLSTRAYQSVVRTQ